MLHTLLLVLHLIGVCVFVGFIFLDRLIFRRFVVDSGFYRYSLRYLIASAMLIIGSGYLLIDAVSVVLIAKLIFAFLLFVLFFGCHKFLEKKSKSARKVYRGFVVLLAFLVLYFGLLLN
jgi:hypothetical protein